MSDDFERQPPPPPPSLDKWLDHSDRADNRREPFFVGREDEYAVFARGARLLRDGTVGGEAIIFQGAPGAGKSALMQECIETARARSTRNKPSVAQSLSVHTLANPHEVCQLLLRALRREQRRLADRGAHPRIGNWLARLQEARDELSARGGVRMGPRPPDGMLAEGAFKTIAGAFEGVCVVLFIDEAQNVPGDAQPAIDVLSRGKTGIDLLPVFFGLGHAARALSEKGRLSRPPAERVVELGALPEADVRESLAMTFHAPEATGHPRAFERFAVTIAPRDHGIRRRHPRGEPWRPPRGLPSRRRRPGVPYPTGGARDAPGSVAEPSRTQPREDTGAPRRCRPSGTPLPRSCMMATLRCAIAPPPRARAPQPHRSQGRTQWERTRYRGA